VGFDTSYPKGWDHILFVLGLLFLSTQLAAAYLAVTAFTRAYGDAGACALDWVSVPVAFVGALDRRVDRLCRCRKHFLGRGSALAALW